MPTDDCPYGNESLVVADYLGGRLPEARARAFEEHSFACNRCFEELRLAADLRASGEAGKRARPRQRRMGRELGLGLAAGIVLAAGLWLALPEAPPPSPEPVFRSGSEPFGRAQQIPLEINRRNGTVRLRWQGTAGADRYTVRVYTADGEALLERETSETALEVSTAAWEASGTLYAQVVALDDLRRTLSRSELVPL